MNWIPRVPMLLGLWCVALAGPLLAEEVKIPFDKLDGDYLTQVRRVADGASFTVTLPHEDVKSNLETYDFMLDHLPFTARVVRGLGLGKYVILPQRADMVVLDDKEGLRSRMTLLLRDTGLRVYYTVGVYDGPVLPKMRATAVIVLTYRPTETGALSTDAKIWFRIESPGYRILAAFVKPTARDEVRKKSVVFISAAKTVAERLAADPTGFREQLRGIPLVKAEELAELDRQLIAQQKEDAQQTEMPKQ
ncbi:MAG: hypothetical protein HYZ53_16970 [Planctomycetes bacterium]|nr:hypothetical protein [Planctomycetota bacterium]